MPSETSFSINTAISEIASARRSEAVRPERGDGRTRPDTFGALVSEAAHARNDVRKELPPVETQKEPVDPRPAPERRPEAKERADRAEPRGLMECQVNDRGPKVSPTDKGTDVTEKGGGKADPDENPACKGDLTAKTTETEVGVEVGATTETTGDVTVTESGKIDGLPVVPGATAIGNTVSVPVLTTAEGTVDGVTANVAGVDKAGGPTPPPTQNIVAPVAEAVAEEIAGSVPPASGPAKEIAVGAATPESSEAETAGSVAEAETPVKAADVTITNTARPAIAASPKPGVGTKTETGIEKAAAEVAAGEETAAGEESAAAKAVGTGADTARKPATPDLNPTRLARVADMLDSLGVSNAIHRPADILAGLDRAVQASALNGAHNRAAEIARATPLQMLPIEIGMQAVRGVTNFQIRLDPAELGRVDVKLQIRDNGEVNASLVVDRVETLAMLKRDASTLQQAFEQAGLRQSADGLSFSLRGEGQNGEARRDTAHGSSGSKTDENTLPAEIAEVAMRRAYVPNSNLDLMI